MTELRQIPEQSIGEDLLKNKKPLRNQWLFSAPSGARTLDPNIKSVVLYQLS